MIKFVCREWLVDELIKLNVSKKNIYVLKDRRTYDLGKFTVKPIETYHDVQNTSYLIDFKSNTMYYATDTCELPDDECLKGLNYYFIEANYKEELLEEHIKNCSEEEMYYLSRVPHTHLSYEQANEFLINNMGKNSEYQYIHQSKYNFKEEDNTDGSIK